MTSVQTHKVETPRETSSHRITEAEEGKQSCLELPGAGRTSKVSLTDFGGSKALLTP